MTSSWFFLSTLKYDARSTTHQAYSNYDIILDIKFLSHKEINTFAKNLVETLLNEVTARLIQNV